MRSPPVFLIVQPERPVMSKHASPFSLSKTALPVLLLIASIVFAIRADETVPPSRFFEHLQAIMFRGKPI